MAIREFNYEDFKDLTAWCRVDENEIITNIQSCDWTYAQSAGMYPYYEDAVIGEKYDYPWPLTLEERVAALETMLANYQMVKNDVNYCLREIHYMKIFMNYVEPEDPLSVEAFIASRNNQQ